MDSEIVTGVFKSSFVYTSDTHRKIYICELLAVSKSTFADAFTAFIYADFFKSVAILESLSTYLTASVYSYSFKLFAVFKSI